MPEVARPRIDYVHLHPTDTVAIAVRDLPPGDPVTLLGRTIEVTEPIRAGHKLALVDHPVGSPVLRYGQTIGFATRPIAAGDWVHVHNLAAGDFNRDYEYAVEPGAAPPPAQGRTFQGYRRPDGRVGARNYLAVISTVNCSASVARHVCQRFPREILARFPNVTGLLPITHKGGCGLQYGGEDHQQLNRVLAGMARHPNVGGYLLIGLGCETAAMPYLVDNHGLVQIEHGRRTLPPVLSMQDVGGTEKTIAAASRLIEELLPRVNDVRRETCPASALTLGLNCGGSDGASGITANPALGVASDLLVGEGGAAVLAETPEIYGAEHLLVRRARTPEVGRKLIERIRWWERHVGMFGARLDNNPSPGNKDGGLTTIYEKSLGAAAKAGGTALAEVYLYAEQAAARGFTFMDTPGFDPVSVTGLVAGGCQVVVFTTGRGSCFGCKPSPTIKVATNTPMYERMVDDMDIDAGAILSAGLSVADVGRQIFDLTLEVASGRPTKSEALGYGEEEFAPWSLGPTL